MKNLLTPILLLLSMFPLKIHAQLNIVDDLRYIKVESSNITPGSTKEGKTWTASYGQTSTGKATISSYISPLESPTVQMSGQGSVANFGSNLFGEVESVFALTINSDEDRQLDISGSFIGSEYGATNFVAIVISEGNIVYRKVFPPGPDKTFSFTTEMVGGVDYTIRIGAYLVGRTSTINGDSYSFELNASEVQLISHQIPLPLWSILLTGALLGVLGIRVGSKNP